MKGVSFVVPVHNGALWIRECLQAILAQADGRPMEVIVVDDHSTDGSSELLQQLAVAWPVRVVTAQRRGAAAAINTGIAVARHPIVCQIDQDVFVQPGWMRVVTEALDDPEVAAAQGYYSTDPGATLYARAMNLDLEQRYDAIDGNETDHVCTGNSAYRADALRRIGLFDEALGYGYDNDVSYRLRAAGFRLVICRTARSVHRWREGFSGYLLQQYGFGYGRLDVVAKHPLRVGGDFVAPAAMMAHPLLMSIAIAAWLAAAAVGLAGGDWQDVALAGTAIFASLVLERLAAGLAAAWRFGSPAALLFPALHVARDLAWVAAIAVWSARRAHGRPSLPSHSMYSRPAVAGPNIPVHAIGRKRILCLLPAYNEAANLPVVVEEIRRRHPRFDVLVVDDGSTDGTAAILPQLGVRWMRLPERMGIGTAMRAGLRYAERVGYDIVIRMDGDGQHRADDVDQLLAALDDGADVVLGSRFTESALRRSWLVQLVQRVLAVCLSTLTGKRVTDPTSGFCALGPRAVRVLAEHHPTGYPEPELRLFLSNNGLRTVEVPVSGRSRFVGKTSLTPKRMTAAGARVMLAMLVVPFRGRVESADD